MNLTSRTHAIALVALLAGCTNSVQVSGGGQETGGSGGSAVVPGTSVVATTGSSGVFAATTGSSGGNPCGTTLSPAEFGLSIESGSVSSWSDAGDAASITVEGVVLASPSGNLTVDTCLPGNGCFDARTTLTVTAPNLPALLAPVNALVRLRVASAKVVGSYQIGTAAHVLVENLAELSGVTNPVYQGNRVWFAGYSTDGGSTAPPVGEPDPYTLDSQVQCQSSQSSSGSQVRAFMLTFPGAPTVEIPQGEARTLEVSGAFAGTYVFQSLTNNFDIDGMAHVSYWLTGS